MLTSSKSDVALAADPKEVPIEALRQILFAVNLIEDVSQDAVVNLAIVVPKVATIFDMIPDVSLIANYIRNARSSS